MSAVYLILDNAAQSSVVSSCTNSQYLNCKTLFVISNSISTRVVFLFVDPQQYSITSGYLLANLTGYGHSSSKCSPNFVLPGGLMECDITINKKVQSGQLLSGTFSFSSNVCTAATESGCASPIKQVYPGTFTAYGSSVTYHSNLPLPSCRLRLLAQNSTENANGAQDKLTASVYISNYPISGATVSFSSNSPQASISQEFVNTDSNGNSVSYVSSTSTGTVTLSASFGNCTTTSQILFGPAYELLTLISNPSNTGTLSPNSGNYAYGSTQPISASPATGYLFGGWTGTGSGSYTGSNAFANVIMTSDIVETAHFSGITYSGTNSVCTNNCIWLASPLLLKQIVVNSPSNVVINTYLSPQFWAWGLAFDKYGDPWFISGMLTSTLREYSETGNLILNLTIPDVIPYAITIDNSGNIWIGASVGWPLQFHIGIIRLSPSGTILDSYGLPYLNPVVGLTSTSAGTVWGITGPLSSNTGYLYEFSAATGNILNYWGIPVNPISNSDYQVGITSDSNGNIWYTTGASNTIVEVSGTGKALGTYAAGNGPIALAIDFSGNVWVADYYGDTVTELSSSGTILGVYPAGQQPFCVVTDTYGDVWVCDSSWILTELSSTGKTINTFNVVRSSGAGIWEH